MKYLAHIFASITVCALYSCSLINTVKNYPVRGSQATIVNRAETQPAKPVAAAETKTDKTVETKADNKIEKKSESKNIDPNLVKRIAGEWIIISVNGKTIPIVDEMPYVTFEMTSGKFYASNGCNIFNGSFSIVQDRNLRLDNVLSTLKMCQDNDFEDTLTKVFSGSEKINIKINDLGHETFLRFFNAKGVELLSARKHNMDFLNGNWQITSVAGKSIDDDESTLFIDINELKIHGNTGCNFFNGIIYISPDKSNAIDFSNLASTRMACRNMDREAAIILALEETATAIEGSDNRVMFISSSGKELMTLRRLSITAE